MKLKFPKINLKTAVLGALIAFFLLIMVFPSVEPFCLYPAPYDPPTIPTIPSGPTSSAPPTTAAPTSSAAPPTAAPTTAAPTTAAPTSSAAPTTAAPTTAAPTTAAATTAAATTAPPAPGAPGAPAAPTNTSAVPTTTGPRRYI